MRRPGAYALLILCALGLKSGSAQGQVPSTPGIPPLIPPTPSFNGGVVRQGSTDATKKSSLRETTLDTPPLPEVDKPSAPKPPTPSPAPGSRTGIEARADAATASNPAAPATDTEPDPKEARAYVEARLAALPVSSETQKVTITPSQKTLRETLTERLKWIEAYEKATKDREAAENPNPNPEQEAAAQKSEYQRAKALLDATENQRFGLLPQHFRVSDPHLPEGKLTEMRDAIDLQRNEVKDRSDELEKLRGKPGLTGNSPVFMLRAERDKTSQRIAALAARRLEREKAIRESSDADTKEIATEKRLTFAWESWAENQRLKAGEAQIRLEVKRSDLNGVMIQSKETQLRLAKLTLEQMQARYRELSDLQQSTLKLAAEKEARKATKSDDALERFRAQRAAEQLELEAALTNDEKAYAANPRLSLQEQSQLADRAQTEFAELKALLKDEKISSLDALQLNNDFRRVARERNLIRRNELAEASAIMAYYENQLTQLELDLLSDSRDDRFELENLLSLLPVERHAEARALAEKIDTDHRNLLVKRRAVLDKLCARAKVTYNQVNRRLQTLDEEYAFVRANLFWIRDAEPIGLGTFTQAKREVRHLVSGLIRLTAECLDRRMWAAPSVEFVTVMILLGILPIILVYTRKSLRKLA